VRRKTVSYPGRARRPAAKFGGLVEFRKKQLRLRDRLRDNLRLNTTLDQWSIVRSKPDVDFAGCGCAAEREPTFAGTEEQAMVPTATPLTVESVANELTAAACETACALSCRPPPSFGSSIDQLPAVGLKPDRLLKCSKDSVRMKQDSDD